MDDALLLQRLDDFEDSTVVEQMPLPHLGQHHVNVANKVPIYVTYIGLICGVYSLEVA